MPSNSSCGVIRCRIKDNTASVHIHNFIQNNMSSLPLPIMHYVEIPQGNHPLTSGLEAILGNGGSVSCPFSSRHIQVTYQFSQEVFRMDGIPYLEKEAGRILKGVTRKSKGVTPRKLTRIAIMPKICALLQKIPDAKNYST